jgi:hypothetical protein
VKPAAASWNAFGLESVQLSTSDMMLNMVPES